ncbi:ATP-binding protein [Amycolatopsis regifaucium]|uniref:LuxR family transcriptional regulator n=1 Tax=Amycolatopsis regifaucium TaxID=546365 RepID=A0A154MUL2_9PSEU|nr:LuxR family transcriptional regulator [Amycolatopsis regifaucium]KZB87975.1 LuxR family transcriptional regulator [Amycolatopsis regifaucium]OKA04522.1 LuxR family transcriptional regulator [Amycolatopsis regifaucium]
MEDILDAVLEAEKPLVLLTGLAGTGRTNLLARLSERYEADRRHVSAMRFTSTGDVAPARFALPTDELRGETATKLRGPIAGEPAWASIGPVAGAAEEPAVALRAAHAAAAALRRAGDGTVLLLDDLQWIDRSSLAVLEALIPMLDGRRLTCVGALRVPANGAAARYGPEALARLRKENLILTLRMRPLTKDLLMDDLRNSLEAAPQPALVDHVHALSRGVRSAVSETVEALRRRGAIRVVNRSAYFVPAMAAKDPLPPGESVATVRALGTAAWETAKAMAFLCPLGSAAPRLAATVLGVSEQDLLDRLETLRAAGVLHRAGASWRFPLPRQAAALAESCGPYERRILAEAAVEALWSHTADCPDLEHRTNLLAEAGRSVDPARASEELIRRATEAGPDGTASALRWLDAAAELAGDRAERAKVLLLLVAAYHRNGDYEQSLRTIRLVLGDFADQLDPDAVFEAHSLLLRGLSGRRDTEPLRDIADGDHRLAGDPGSRALIRATACALLDRWVEAVRWADAAVPAIHSRGPQAVVARLLSALGGLWQGRAEFFERSLLERRDWPLRDVAPYRVELVDTHLTGLLLNGELDRADNLLADEELSWEEVGPANRTTAAVLRGDFRTATELACRSVAYRSAPGFTAATTGMFAATVSALVCQGRLTTARELATAAGESTPVLAQLMDFTEALIDRALGDPRRAADRLTTALSVARERGLVVGCDTAGAELADLALDLDDPRTAESCLVDIERLAAALPTGRAVLLASFVRAAVTKNADAAAECLRMAHERGQPFELSVLIARLVKHGVADPALLSEAYELMGGLGALMHRAKTRTLMQKHGIVVPGRRNTVEENERLLATLAAEGLSNKQIAAALITSEKSVEGRLSRLFTRSGYRSRIELSTAIATGELRL